VSHNAYSQQERQQEQQQQALLAQPSLATGNHRGET
jgi:hypothetical protein